MENKNNINMYKNIVKHTYNSMSFNMFPTDGKFNFLYKKTERVVAAIYMITNLFRDSEPLKWKLRKESSDLLSLILILRNYNGAVERDIDSITNSFSEVLSLFNIGYYAGIISQMNFEVVNREFESLIDTLTDYSNNHLQKQNIFGNNFFDDGKILSSISTDEISKGQKNEENNFKRTESVTKDVTVNVSDKIAKPNPVNKVVVNVNSSKSNEALKDIYDVKSSSDLKKSNRRSLIINIIRKKGSVMINDIAPAIKGCSEKTIQRELAALVEKGILIKTGERRWSKYRIA